MGKETNRTNLPEMSVPDHEWEGDEHGHNCAACPDDSPWRCDRHRHPNLLVRAVFEAIDPELAAHLTDEQMMASREWFAEEYGINALRASDDNGAI